MGKIKFERQMRRERQSFEKLWRENKIVKKKKKRSVVQVCGESQITVKSYKEN